MIVPFLLLPLILVASPSQAFFHQAALQTPPPVAFVSSSIVRTKSLAAAALFASSSSSSFATTAGTSTLTTLQESAMTPHPPTSRSSSSFSSSTHLLPRRSTSPKHRWIRDGTTGVIRPKLIKNNQVKASASASTTTLPEYLTGVINSSRSKSEEKDGNPSGENEEDLRDVAEIIMSIREGCSAISTMVKRSTLDGHGGYLYEEEEDGGDDGDGGVNVQGERQKKLDVMGNDAFKDALARCGKVWKAISEEDEKEIVFGNNASRKAGSSRSSAGSCARYVVAFDPLDGSSNVDCGIPVGTIFGVYKVEHEDEMDGSVALPGELVAAGYCFYSSATSFVFSFGGESNGVQGFTLDEATDEFRLTHPNMKIPTRGSVVSFNEANRDGWDRPMREYVSAVQSGTGETKKRYSSRYVGSMVGDIHRTLLNGGVFGYPADDRNPYGKLRLLYEAAPMGWLVEKAGGKALVSGGCCDSQSGQCPVNNRILDIEPTSIHERTPCVMGSYDDVSEIQRYYRKDSLDLASAERLSERLDEYLSELEAFMAE